MRCHQFGTYPQDPRSRRRARGASHRRQPAVSSPRSGSRRPSCGGTASPGCPARLAPRRPGRWLRRLERRSGRWTTSMEQAKATAESPQRQASQVWTPAAQALATRIPALQALVWQAAGRRAPRRSVAQRVDPRAPKRAGSQQVAVSGAEPLPQVRVIQSTHAPPCQGDARSGLGALHTPPGRQRRGAGGAR